MATGKIDSFSIDGHQVEAVKFELTPGTVERLRESLSRVSDASARFAFSVSEVENAFAQLRTVRPTLNQWPNDPPRWQPDWGDLLYLVVQESMLRRPERRHQRSNQRLQRLYAWIMRKDLA